MNYNDKQQKLISTIVGLYNKINDIKKDQIYIKAFEKDIDNCLKNLFPNTANQLNDIKEENEWVIQILESKSESEVLDNINRISVCEQICLEEINNQNYKEENVNLIGDEKKLVFKQIELLKNRFDDIIIYMKDLEREIVTLEKKYIDCSLKDLSTYE